jgi:chemosensory pili system protein ChpA (sensor histidine kinase/response regulator)
MSTPNHFDIGPLTWVKGEIDQALERSLGCLRAYVANPADSNQIRFAQTHFHQAHGALQIVGLDGVTRVSEELDGLLGDIAAAGGSPRPEAVAVAERVFDALTTYLSRLLAGEPNQPVRLFSIYRELTAARGREALDPVDLYYPDLTPRPPRREQPLLVLAPDSARRYFREQRGRYQRGLLKWLRKDGSGVEDMRAAVAAVEATQANPSARAFWWVALGFFDALFAKAITDQPSATRLASRIEQQLKRLVEGSATVAERLLREALFAVARARPATAHVREVQEVFRLAGTAPIALELRSDGAPHQPILRELRELLGNAKLAWNKVAAGHQPSLSSFRELAGQCRERAEQLQQPDVLALSRDVTALAGFIGEQAARVNDSVAMEVATALLLLESAVENYATLGAEFAQEVEIMRTRLRACAKGETPKASTRVPALDEMSRRAQERLLMAQVVAEIQGSLRTIEQALDAFFRDPSKRSELAPLDKPLRQVLGALTMLNEDRAAAILSTCAAEIQRFEADGYVPAAIDFERVAGALSALGFYVDALQHGKADFEQFMQPITAKKTEAVEAPEAPPASATVEAELERGKRELQSLADQWRNRPEDVQLKEDLKAKASVVHKDAELVADAKLASQAAEIVQGLDAADVTPTDPRVSQVLSTITPAVPEPSPETQKLMAASEEIVDAELLAVYLEEAGDVLGTIEQSTAGVRELPQDIEGLRTIRRGFHTLKGSGRMVGLTRLGEAAWALEQVMNGWLEEERSATPELLTLIDTARQFFQVAVATLKAGGASPDESRVVALAQRVKAGEPLDDLAISQAIPVLRRPVSLSEPVIDVAEVAPARAADTLSLPAEGSPVEIAGAAPESAMDEVIAIGDVRLSPALYQIFIEESRAHLARMTELRARLDSGEQLTDEFERAAHTLAGIGGTVKLDAICELAHALEGLVGRMVGRRVDSDAQTLLGEALVALDAMRGAAVARRLPEAAPGLIGQLEAYGRTFAAADDLEVSALDSGKVPGEVLDQPDLASEVAQTPAEPEAATPASFEDSSHTVRAAEPLTVEPDIVADVTAPSAIPQLHLVPPPLAEPAAAVEIAPVSAVERRQRRFDDDVDADLLPIFLEEAQELVPAVGQGIRDWRSNPANATVGHALQRTLHTLKGSARMCGAMGLGELTHAMESRVESALAEAALPPTLFDDLDGSYDRMVSLHERLLNPQSFRESLPTAPAAPEQAAPVALGPASIEEGAPAPAAPQPAAAHVQPSELDFAAQSRGLLRVRADLIDRLVNEAGEVSIARSRIEGDMRAVKGALFELTENVNRLRAQLREIEIQAEGQMQSGVSVAHESDQPFDPLEFDRFTRFQEITRMMAESVNDVSTVHQSLLKAVGDSEIALLAQARLTRSLQADLLRVRMVPFAGVAERLYRVVRQAAKETGKRAVLDVRGGQVELDRSVLERVTAPFEHMLRNAVAHGIEPAADRVAKGKPELGEIKVDVRQEGNEIVLTVADDGAGLDYDRIRAKAISLGLLARDAMPADAEVAECIFHPGFSTAREVTQLAGRGVGMDVVKSEITALGGRVELTSEAGKGTRFTVFLPLTLAVTQAVLVRAAGVTYAIPAVMVEQVRQVKADELAAHQAAGEVRWQNRRFPFRYLPRLLANTEAAPETRRLTPVMFLRTGANTVAVQLDEVIGTQEIVVKNTGPLLARVAGITGATVLGSGEIVLIINPIILIGRESAALGRARPIAPIAELTVEPETPVAPTVMIVDDSLTVRKITGRLLAREGYQVLTAKDGVDALEQLLDVVPDVMLVDIEMPRMDGFDLTRNVRADQRLAHVPIIMITSRTAEKHRSFAREIGVNVYLGKPYQEDELLGHIAGFVRKLELA